MSYLVNFLGGRKQLPDGVAFTQTSTVTVANTATETALSDGGVGSLVFPANFFRPGTSLTVYGMGYHSSLGAVSLRIRVKLNSTVVLDTGANSSGNDTNAGFDVYGLITCRTAGVSGTVFAQGYYEEDGTTPTRFEMVNTSATTINTTISQTLSITAEWGSASPNETISLTNLIVEIKNP